MEELPNRHEEDQVIRCHSQENQPSAESPVGKAKVKRSTIAASGRKRIAAAQRAR